MYAIHKYAVEPGYFTVEMPRSAKVLSVAMQRDVAQMWALVDTDETVVWRFQFACVGTGHELPGGAGIWKFIGTFLTDGGDFVFHLFQVNP